MSTTRTHSTQPQPAHQPKPPTPVADEHLHEELRRMSGYTAQLLLELKALREAAADSDRARSRDVAKGVFFGSIFVMLLGFAFWFVVGLAAAGL